MDQLKSSTIEPRYERFVFEGSGKEYFRIWIVNIALSILTLGIYSAWAKVRANRYLYANTYIHGSNFEYNADPIRILLGRIVVIVGYGLFVLFSEYLMMKEIALAIALVALIAMPWLIRQAISFKLRNTSYRNIPFRYVGETRSFYLFFLLHIFLNIFTLFLAFPYSYVKFKELLINNAQYGEGRFSFHGSIKESYKTFAKVFIFSMLIIGGVMMLLSLIGMGLSSILGGDPTLVSDLNESMQMGSVLVEANSSLPSEVMVEDANITLSNAQVYGLIVGGFVMIFIVALIYLPIIFWQKGFSDGYFSNFVRNSTMLEDAPMRGTIKPFRLGVIAMSNVLMILFSFGLLYPWAKIRYLKYLLEHTEIACENPDTFDSLGYEVGSTVGEEMMDFFDIDIGI
jgi:uncharacterized membrane protein YjgN (DUF898 family)